MIEPCKPVSANYVSASVMEGIILQFYTSNVPLYMSIKVPEMCKYSEMPAHLWEYIYGREAGYHLHSLLSKIIAAWDI